MVASSTISVPRDHPGAGGAPVRLHYLGPPEEVGELVFALRSVGVGVRYRPPREPMGPLTMITAVALVLEFPAGDPMASARAGRVVERFAAAHPRTRVRLDLPPSSAPA